MPLFPFFVINLVMGLTRISVVTFAWVSRVGMLLGTIVYVNAGTQLAAIDSLSGILSPGLIFSFVLLRVFPLIAKDAGGDQGQKGPGRILKPEKFDRNLIVIGAGSGGLVASLIAAAVKSKVTLIEAQDGRGLPECRLCVPSKALIRSALHQADQTRIGVRIQIPPLQDLISRM